MLYFSWWKYVISIDFWKHVNNFNWSLKLKKKKIKYRTGTGGAVPIPLLDTYLLAKNLSALEVSVLQNGKIPSYPFHIFFILRNIICMSNTVQFLIHTWKLTYVIMQLASFLVHGLDWTGQTIGIINLI